MAWSLLGYGYFQSALEIRVWLRFKARFLSTELYIWYYVVLRARWIPSTISMCYKMLGFQRRKGWSVLTGSFTMVMPLCAGCVSSKLFWKLIFNILLINPQNYPTTTPLTTCVDFLLINSTQKAASLVACPTCRNLSKRQELVWNCVFFFEHITFAGLLKIVLVVDGFQSLDSHFN